MTKRFTDRLAALEALERATPAASVAVDVAGLPEATLYEHFAYGLREQHLLYVPGGVRGERDPFWRAVAERAQVTMHREQRWCVAVAPVEIRLVLDALDAGVMTLTVREDHWPIWYCFAPPEPFPDRWYDTPPFQAATYVQRVLRGYYMLLDGGADVPRTREAVYDWLSQLVEQAHEAN